MTHFLFLYGSDTGYRFSPKGARPRTSGSSGVAAELDRRAYHIRDLLLAPLRSGQYLDFKLGPYDAILNAIGDPDLNPKVLKMAERICARAALPVLNPPERIWDSTRSGVYERAGGDDLIMVPRTLRIEGNNDAELIAALERMKIDFPVLIRPVGSHAGKGLAKHDTREELIADVRGRLSADAGQHRFYVTEFHDFASKDGLYRKYRFYLIGDSVYPRHTMVAAGWDVHGRSQLAMTEGYEHLIEEEKAFRADFDAALGEDRRKGLARLLRSLGLDFCGIDCTLLEDGRLLVFEANPNMDMRKADPDSPRYELNMSSYESIRDAMHKLLEETAANAGKAA